MKLNYIQYGRYEQIKQSMQDEILSRTNGIDWLKVEGRYFDGSDHHPTNLPTLRCYDRNMTSSDPKEIGGIYLFSDCAALCRILEISTLHYELPRNGQLMLMDGDNKKLDVWKR